MAKKTKKLTQKEFKKKLVNIVNKYGVATVLFKEEYPVYSYDNSSYVTAADYRKRRIYKNGKCEVAYKGHKYNKFSRYQESCFVAYRPVNASGTIQRMIRHDSTEIIPVEIRVKRRRIKL